MALLPPPDISAAYVNESRPSKDFYNWIKSLYDSVRGVLQSTLFAPAVAVGSLPAGVAGQRHFVTDATATTFGSIVAGGGANKVPVYNDGTNWRIG